MKRALEIEKEDEEWAGEIDLRIFQQVKDQQEKARIIAKLEAQNRVKRQDGDAEQEKERLWVIEQWESYREALHEAVSAPKTALNPSETGWWALEPPVAQVFKSLLPHRFLEPPLIGEAWNVDEELNHFAAWMAPLSLL